MRFRFLLAGLAIALAAFPASAAPEFSRGINLARLHSLPAPDRDNPGSFLWPPFQGPLSLISDEEIRRLVALGFDYVRLPVAPAPFLTVDDAKRSVLFDELEETVRRLQAAGLGVLVDPHPTHGGVSWSAPIILSSFGGEVFDGYADWLAELAGRLAALDTGRLALGLMNEPQSECHITLGRDWTEIQPVLYTAVRDAAPALAVALTTGCWSGFDALPHLDMAGYDDNTLVDVHYYSPFYFTHQGLPFASEPVRYISGLWYPASEGDDTVAIAQSEFLIAKRRDAGNGNAVPDDALDQARQGISRYYDPSPVVDRTYTASRFARMRKWVDEQGIDPGRFLIGEFGAARPPEGLPANASRYAWLEDVRRNAEEAGFGWALWDYNAGYGYPGFGLVLDNDTGDIDRKAVEALGLTFDLPGQ